jgi:hypothetical protein
MNAYQRRMQQNRVSGLQLVGAMAALGALGGGGGGNPALHALSAIQRQSNAGSPAAALIAAGVHPAIAAAISGNAYPLQGATPGGAQLQAVETSPTDLNRFPFPMPAATIAATSAGVSNATAQVVTKPVRLVMSESAGPSSLTDISIGIFSQFGSLTGNFPISAFSNNATDSLVGFRTAQTGQAIVLSLFNSGAGATTVLSGFLCDVAT